MSAPTCYNKIELADSLLSSQNSYEQENGYGVVMCPDEPSVEGLDPLVDAKLVYETHKICFAYVTLKPGGSVPASGFVTNEVDQIILCISGNGIAVYPDKVYDVFYDVAAYNHAGQPHKYINTGTEDMILLVAYYADKFSEIGYKTVEVESFK